MKTPSLPLLALAAALSSSAAATDAPRRCSADWLKKTSAAASQGGIPDNTDKSLIEVSIEGGTRWVVDLDADSFPCDKPLKRFLATPGAAAAGTLVDAKTGKPLGGSAWQWSDAGLQQAWNKGLDQQVRILSAADELYDHVDARGRAVLKAADDVVDAAVTLGVVAKTPGAGVDKIKDYAGAAYAADNGYTVAAPAASPAVKPEDLKAALGKLLKDKTVKGGKTTVEIGPAVLAYRKAVIELADELAVRSARRDLLAKLGVDASAKTDFAPGAKVVAFAAFASVKGRDGTATLPDAVAEKDTNYTAALGYLTDPGIKDMADAAAHDNVVLSRFDYGLRNLVAFRAAAVEAAVDAAKKKLGTSTVKAALGGVDRDAKTVAPAKPGGAGPDLSAGVLAKLSQTKDFQDLNALFEAKSKSAAADPKGADAQWLASPAGQEAKQKLDTMRADAAATKVAGNSLQYSVGGTALSSGIRVPGLKSEAYRGAIEDAVVLAILKGNTFSAELEAARQAFRNPSGKPIPDPVPPAAKVPPVKEEPPKAPASAWDKIVQTTPEPHWYNSAQGRLDSYLSTQREQAAADADAAAQKRREVQRQADRARAAEASRCDDEKAEIAKRPADPLWKPEVAAKWRSDMLQAKVKECDGRIQGAFDKVVADAKLSDPKDVAEAKRKRNEEADALIAQAYVDGIAASVDELRKEYKDDKTPRAKKAASESGFLMFYGKHLDLVDGYFTKTWEGDKKAESTKACQGLLWYPAKGSGDDLVRGEFRDPSVENVDGRCVHGGLVTHLKGYIGKGDKAD